MTVISSAPMPLPRVRLGNGTPTTSQTAVTVPSPTVMLTARPGYLGPHAFAPAVLYGAYNFSGQGLGRARYIGRPTSPGWSMSQGRGGRFGAPLRTFAPSVLYGAYQFQGQGLGRVRTRRRVRLAGIERFAPSVLYGAWNMQAQGLGRYRPMNRPIRGRMGCCGGYPVKRLGQNALTDLWNSVVNAGQNIAGGLPINAPNAGGGSVTVGQPFVAQHDFTLPDGTVIQAGQTVTPAEATAYVNAQGTDQATVDPTAGQTPSDQLQQAASDMPWWGWALLVGGGGLLAYKVFK